MSENQPEPSSEVPNVHENAVTGLGHQPVQGATATGYAEPETVDHPTSGDPDATPEEQAADNDVMDDGTADNPSQTTEDPAQTGADGQVDSGATETPGDAQGGAHAAADPQTGQETQPN